MGHDAALVIGLALAAFSIPAMVSAWSDARTPRASALLLLVALGLVTAALRGAPGGYALSEIPEVFVRVLARWLP